MKFGIHSTDTAPHITSITPLAALPGGEVEVHGRRLATEAYRQPTATIGEQPSPVSMSHGSKVLLHVPDGAISGNVQLRVDGHTSNAMPLSVGVAIADDMDPVASPVVDPEEQYLCYIFRRSEASRRRFPSFRSIPNTRPVLSPPAS